MIGSINWRGLGAKRRRLLLINRNTDHEITAVLLASPIPKLKLVLFPFALQTLNPISRFGCGNSTMKRAMPWSDEEDDDSDSEAENLATKSTISSKADKSSNQKTREVKCGKQKSSAIDFEALRQHGYKGGLSVLNVPPPKEEEKHDWTWSTGKESREMKETVESYEERLKTRAAVMDGEELANVQTRKEKKNFSFSQKEKRKRELGQASRGKNYVEEEKRLLRDSGVYSGFDT